MNFPDLLFNLHSSFGVLLGQLNGIKKKGFLPADTMNIDISGPN